LIQEVAYNTLLQRKRTEIHEEIGKAIEALYADRLEEFYEMLAHHYSKSESSEKAYHYLKLSGNKAARSHSLREAFRFYREAINVLSKTPQTDAKKRQQIEVRLLLSVPMLLLGYPDESLQILQEGERYAKEIGDIRHLSIFYGKLAHYYVIKKGEPLVGIRYSENGFTEAEKTRDIELIAPIACELCSSYLIAGRFSKIVDVSTKVIALIQRKHREKDFFGTRYNVYSGLCGHCASAFAWLGNFNEAKVLCEEGLRYAMEINSKYGAGWVELSYGLIFLTMGDGKNAIEHLEKSIGYFEETQAFYILGLAWSYFGFGYYLMGDLKLAQEYIQKGLVTHSDAGVAYWRSFQLSFLSIVHLGRADLESAQRCAEEALRLSQEKDEKQMEGWARIWLGRTMGKANTSRAKEAERSILWGINICNELELKPYAAQGYHCLGQHFVDKCLEQQALTNLKKAEAMFREMGMDYWLGKTQKVLGSLKRDHLG
jgi:tetratricopeptide (TPR) repeat protein